MAYRERNQQRWTPPHNRKKRDASVWFCWCFAAVVCVTFGLASFLMFSAGHFDSFSSSQAWGDDGDNNNSDFVRGNLISVEVTELGSLSANDSDEEFYAHTGNLKLDEFGPLPGYLSDYESIILSETDDGTKIPVYDDEEVPEIITAQEHEEIDLTPADKNNNQAEKENVVLAEKGSAWHEYIVKSGETLSDIAVDNGGITAQDILKANGLKNADKLAEGQLLLIPNDTSKIDETLDEVRTRQMRVAAIREKTEPLEIKSYVVAPGDSLWSISNSQNIELDTLVGSNTFKSSSRLRPGAVLRIPNQDGIFYVMKKGEKLEAVAKRYGVSMNKLRAVNVNKDLTALKTGEEIFLPGARPEGVIEPKEDVKKAEVKKSPSAKVANAKEKSKSDKKVIAYIEPAVKSSGYYRWPVMGRINSPFGWRQHPITKRHDFHTGIDIKGERNDPIKAAASGRVIYSGWMGGYGKVLVIEHNNGQSTLYAHCSTLMAAKGASVSSGQVVAKIGTTGRSTGPHLHFEVRNGNSPVNPIKYLSR